VLGLAFELLHAAVNPPATTHATITRTILPEPEL
jgi:hypothetical protein